MLVSVAPSLVVGIPVYLTTCLILCLIGYHIFKKKKRRPTNMPTIMLGNQFTLYQRKGMMIIIFGHLMIKQPMMNPVWDKLTQTTVKMELDKFCRGIVFLIPLAIGFLPGCGGKKIIDCPLSKVMGGWRTFLSLIWW